VLGYRKAARYLKLALAAKVISMADQICLKCGRGEYDSKKTTCRDCGGTLWFPQNVGGKPGNTSVDEARRLIKSGKKPWEKA
jgi:hypothetical protein